jgi:hypothetical protein
MSEAFHINNKKSRSTESLASNIRANASPKIDNKKPEQWVMRLPAKASEILDQYCCNKAIVAPFQEDIDAQKPQLIAACYEGFLKKWWLEKTRPSNPLVQTIDDEGLVDSQCIFVLNDKFNINIQGPQENSQFTPDWAREAAVSALVNAGFAKAKAAKFVEMEIEAVVETHFLTLTEMMEGHVGAGRRKIPPSADTQEAGRKMLLFLNWNGKNKSIESLSNEEINAITYNKVSWIPRPSILERIFNHAKNLDDLKAILSVFSPVLTIRSEDYAVSADHKDRQKKLAAAVKGRFA